MRKTVLMFAVLAGITAAIVVVAGTIILSGVIPIKASSRHWPITAALLDFVKVRSVATHSIGISVPFLDDPSLVLRGAGHYETGCKPCHGSPERPLPKIPAGMTPHPPDLHQQVSRWQPEELFYIVKHGIKFTGMPAWPAAGRDDEVWAIAAFLRTLPEMDAEGYARLVGATSDAASQEDPVGPSTAVLALAGAACGRCHGVDGRGRENAAFPRLAGQRVEYLRLALEAYASGSRHSGMMAPVAAGLSAGTMREVAEYYGGLAPAAGDGAAAPRGAEIAARGIPAQEVPACAECHGPASTDHNPAYPRLAGQFPEYLVLQLRLFADGRRGGSPYAHIMGKIAPRLTDAQMSDVAAYYGSLPTAAP